jgi:glycosyltransferase involved in cell wall biosynthesis
VGGIQADVAPTKRVLMIAHHFPPAGGSGSNRALAFARYLPEYGWEPTVVTPGAAWASPRDDGLLAELPAGLRVIRTRSWEPRPPAPRDTRGAGDSSQAAPGRGGPRPDAASRWRAGQGAGNAETHWRSGLASGGVETHWRGGLEPGNAETHWQGGLASGGVEADWRGGPASGDVEAQWRAGPGSGELDAHWRAGPGSGDAETLWRGGPGSGELEAHWPGGPGSSEAAAWWRGGAGAAARRRWGALRSNVGHAKRFPDAHLGWLPWAVAAGRRVSYDVAYSSSGPFTSHLVGLALKRLTGRPWVAELRDGWYRWNRAIFPDYPAWRDVLERQLEAMVMRSADRVVLVTDRMADAFRAQYPTLPPSHFISVPNGFDRLQIPDFPLQRPSTGAFEVLHAGALYYGRSLSAFLEAAARLVRTDAEFGRRFKLSLIGSLDARARAELGHHSLGQHIVCSGQLDHASTIQAMRAADVLLLVANTTPGAEATVPGKLFEYLAIGRPILAIAPRVSSTADVLEQTGGGWLAPAGDPAAIACALHQAFRAHQAAGAEPAVGSPARYGAGPDPVRVARYDRRLLAADLAAIFNAADAARRF